MSEREPMLSRLRIRRILVVAIENSESTGRAGVVIVVVPIDCVVVLGTVATADAAAAVVVATGSGLGCPKIADEAAAIASSEPIGPGVAVAIGGM